MNGYAVLIPQDLLLTSIKLYIYIIYFHTYITIFANNCSHRFNYVDMKKLFYLFTCAMFMVACSQDEIIDESTQTELSNKKTVIRSYEEALEIAQKAPILFNQKNSIKTRCGSEKIVNERNGVFCITSDILTRSGGQDTLLYVFNYENEEGFAIISANKNKDALLAVTESGSYNPEEGSDNPGFNIFMNMAEQYSIGDGDYELIVPPFPLLQSKQVTDTLSYYNIPTKIGVKWGQGVIYNLFCNNGKTGCANTAAAMVMAYYQYPTSIQINFADSVNYILTPNWQNINGHIVGNYYTDCCPGNTHKSIAQIMRQLGHLANSIYYEYPNYIDNETGTEPDSIRLAMISLGYNASEITQYNLTNIKNSLNNDQIILMIGYNSSGKGHMWIVDGYYELHTLEHHYFSSDLGLTWYEAEGFPVEKQTSYNHINWGWDGKSNGMFHTGVFDPQNPISLDSGGSLHPSASSYYDIKFFSIYH